LSRSYEPTPRGEVHSGEIGFILDRQASLSVGMDVPYIDAQTAARQTMMIEGVPVLAAEVLSPSNTQQTLVFTEWAMRDSNPRHHRCKRCALAN